MSRDAMQQALEALMMMRDKYEEYACPEYACPACDHADAAITTLRKALAEPEQHDTDCHAQGICQRSGYSIAPTPRKPLTEPELHAINPTWPAPGQEWGYEEVLAFVRAIERAHGIGEQHE